MDFFSVIEKRRSVRMYRNSQIDEKIVHKALNAALLAPNTSNIQPWEIYWVRTPQKKLLLVEACLNQNSAKTAAELFVFTVNLKSWKKNALWNAEKLKEENAKKEVVLYYEKLIPFVYMQGPFNLFGLIKKLLAFLIGLFRPMVRGPFTHSALREIFVKSTALACENFMLAMAAQGYGTCPMEGFDETRVKRLLGLGRKSCVVMVISAGEIDPAGIWGERKRLPRNEVCFEA